MENSSEARQDLIDASRAAFVDRSINHKVELRPRLVVNDWQRKEKIIYELDKQLRNCTEFWFSVAFISMSGLILLLNVFEYLKDKNVKGHIITTDYLTFSEPKALRKLLEIPFIDCKVATNESFHTKGYCFKNIDGSFTTLIGSSNITGGALTANKEWNVKTTSLENGEFTFEFIREFETLWNNKDAISLSESWIKKYEVQYKEKNETEEKNVRLRTRVIEPNLMQQNAAKALSDMREDGKKRALLIAATGTGKTYLSAFDVRGYKPKRLLFLVHREQILNKAAESFKDVLGMNIEIGFLTGQKKDREVQYLFSTVQTMSKPEVFKSFRPDYFDYIVIDEVHKAGAPSYRRLINYFKPEFLLGMSATPDRPDKENIYELFDYNIACDIRLKQAMEYNLVCPFHYFGVADISVDGVEVDDDDFNRLATPERAKRIIEKANYFGYSGDRVKGLIFCSRKDSAQELSRLLNEQGLRTVALTGDDSIEYRESMVERLEQDENDETALDYILTVDIFNEGIDIPNINQVIMVRPTESSIIFIQQLGRGLRKLPTKEYVVVIDFIGNYKNSFMIPMALSGDRTYNKDNLRRFTTEGTLMIPGMSSINFDEIAKETIYKTIDNARFSEVALLKREFDTFRNQIGRIPTVKDFDRYGVIDIMRIVDKCGSYYDFLTKYYGDDYKVRFSEDQAKMLRYISQKLLPGKRPHELVMLKKCIEDTEDYLYGSWVSEMENTYKISPDIRIKKSLFNNLTNEFTRNALRSKFSSCVFIAESMNDFKVSDIFKSYLKNSEFRNAVKDIVESGLVKCRTDYQNCYKDTSFSLYQKYTYEDVLRLLNWPNDMNAQNIGGYFYKEEFKTMIVFINYDKDDDAIQYHDRFFNENKLIALSKAPRKVDSSDANHIYKRTPEDKDNRIFLFVRKNKDDNASKEFYFLGEVNAIGSPDPVQVPDNNNPGKTKNAFEITYILETPVRHDIYDYLTANI